MPSALKVALRRGVLNPLKHAYEWLRPFTPKREVLLLGGVPAFQARLLDRAIPPRIWGDYRKVVAAGSRYERALIAGLQRFVKPGDAVVVVGGGFGGTAAWAGKMAGPTGHVDVFEASRKHVGKVQETLALNGLTNVTVHHNVVGDAFSVWGGKDMAKETIPTVPVCDVLELDCEGAERLILDRLSAPVPRVILVETHGVFGAPTALISEKLRALGYDVEDAGVAAEHSRAFCEQHDVRVLYATRPAG